MPQVIVGTFTLNDTEAYEAVSKALSVGFTGAHCDVNYKNTAGCGKALKEAFDNGLKREDFFLMASVTGFHWVDSEFNGTCGDSPACETRTQIEQTFQQLPVDYLDHFFLHMPPEEVMGASSCTKVDDPAKTCQEIMEQWKEMEKWVKSGKIKSLGISNFCPDCFTCLDYSQMTVKPVLNQNEMHVGWGKEILDIGTYNRKRGIVPQAYSPFAGRDHWSDPSVLSSPVLKRIGAAHNKSTASVALKWLTDNQIPVAVQSMNPAHLAADIDLWSWKFTKAEKDELDAYRDNSTFKPSFVCTDWNITEDIAFQI